MRLKGKGMEAAAPCRSVPPDAPSFSGQVMHVYRDALWAQCGKAWCMAWMCDLPAVQTAR